MDPKKMLADLRAQISAKLKERNATAAQLRELRGQDSVDEAEVSGLIAQRDAFDAEIDDLDQRAKDLEAEIARDAHLDELASRSTPAAKAPSLERLEVTQDATYSRASDPNGKRFIADVMRAAMGNRDSERRLDAHMDEARASMDDAARAMFDRAVSTSNFGGYIAPVYAKDLVGPNAKAGRPFADACRKHDLPAEGLQVVLSRITTGTSAAEHTEGASVSSTDIDDTTLTADVIAIAGAQTISHKTLDRASGTLEITWDDLGRAYNTVLDSTLINKATVGLSAIATAVAYTDASPTAAELHPKILAAASAVEAAMLDLDPNDMIAVMHGRRFRWLQSQLTSSWPYLSFPGIPNQNGGVVADAGYGPGVRGVLPSGIGIVVDNNVPTNKGTGTDEDEIYVLNRQEAHLWEDPSAPLMVTAEKVSTNQVEIALYGYIAFTFGRYPTAMQKVGGTGLVTPVF